MRANTLSVCAALVAVWAATLISVGGVATEADVEVLLNRRWAEQVFAEKSAEVKPANRLVIVHEDAPGDTKLGRCAAVNAPPMRLGDSEANTNPRDWCVLQYHLPDERAGMVLAFRRDQSPYGSYDCNLREIDPPAAYQVRMYHSYDPEQPITMSGSDLARLNITISERPGSVIVEYKKGTQP